MEEKKSEGMGNIYTAIGGAILGIGIADQIAKTIVPAMQKLSSGEPIESLRALLPGKEDEPEEEHKKDYKEEYDKKENELIELKRKLAELEEKKAHE